jgi:hypothetical protein
LYGGGGSPRFADAEADPERLMPTQPAEPPPNKQRFRSPQRSSGGGASSSTSAAAERHALVMRPAPTERQDPTTRNSVHIPTFNPDPYPTLPYPTRLGLPNFGYSTYPYPTRPYITWLLNRVPAIDRFNFLLGTSCEWLARLSLVYVAWYKRVIPSIVCSAQCVHG